MGSNTSAQVLDAIRCIVQALRESSRQAEQRVGLTGAQLFVLHTVAKAPGLSLNDLAERTRTHQSSASVVVSRLVKDGLIDRQTSGGDARRAELRLSPVGRARLRRAPTAAQERLIDAVDSLASADRAWLAATLGLVVNRMSAGKRRPPMLFDVIRERKNGRPRHA